VLSVQSRAGWMPALWSLDILNALRSHFSLPFPDTLSHTLSELPEFKSIVRSRKTAGLGQSPGFCGPGGVLDQYLGQKTCLGGSFVQATESILVNLADAARQRGAPARLRNAAQDQRHGGWILNPERQSGRQSEDKVRKLLDSSRQDVQTPGAGVPPAFWASGPCIFAGATPVHHRPEARATIFQTRS